MSGTIPLGFSHYTPKSMEPNNDSILEEEVHIPPDEFKILGMPIKGKMGCVHKASFNKNLIAMKELRNKEPSIQELNKFIKECLTLKKLSHPNILKYIGVMIDIEQGFHLTLLTEWAGSALNEYLYSNYNSKWLSLPAAYLLDIAHQIADGMQFLHSKEILHRDLCPENIFVMENIEDGLINSLSVRIGDFGDSIININDIKNTNSCKEIVGTPRFLAPEIKHPEDYGCINRYSRESDIYSFGCLFYELITGRPPFENLDNMTILESGYLSLNINERLTREGIPVVALLIADRCTEEFKFFRPDFLEVIEMIELCQYLVSNMNNKGYTEYEILRALFERD